MQVSDFSIVFFFLGFILIERSACNDANECGFFFV
jgi:hypothetical protein